MHENGDADSPAFLDDHGMMLSDSYAVNYPGGARYTIDTGHVRRATFQNCQKDH